MPLIKKIDKGSTTVYLWRIEETLEELRKDLHLREASSTRLNGMKSEVHQRGFLSIRHLLKVAGYSDEELLYDENGKPYLLDNKCISISHSFQYATIIISDENVGIDIEMKRDKIKRIATKFCNAQELASVAGREDEIQLLTTIWCAKEAMYKMCNSRSLSFKDDMFVDYINNVCSVESNEYSKLFKYELVDLNMFLLVYSFEN